MAGRVTRGDGRLVDRVLAALPWPPTGAQTRAVAEIVAKGFDKDIVLKVARLLDIAEYKRRQAAPGVKVTLKNFGRDRRYPIVNRFRDTGAPLPEADKSLLKAGAAAKSEAFDF